MVATSAAHPFFLLLVVTVLSVRCAIWARRAFSGKRVWPGSGPVPRLKVGPSLSGGLAPISCLALPLCVMFASMVASIWLQYRSGMALRANYVHGYPPSQKIILGILFACAASYFSLSWRGQPRFLIPSHYQAMLDQEKKGRDDGPSL